MAQGTRGNQAAAVAGGQTASFHKPRRSCCFRRQSFCYGPRPCKDRHLPGPSLSCPAHVRASTAPLGPNQCSLTSLVNPCFSRKPKRRQASVTPCKRSCSLTPLPPDSSRRLSRTMSMRWCSAIRREGVPGHFTGCWTRWRKYSLSADRRPLCRDIQGQPHSGALSFSFGTGDSLPGT